MRNFFEEIDKKKIIIFVGILLLVIVLLFGGALLYNKLFSRKSYEEVENNMKLAAIEYLSSHKEDLPTNENEIVTIKDTELVNNELMKSVNEQLKIEDYTCDGSVIITNINGNYRYNPILDCGDRYQTTKFIDYISNNEAIVESGNGLYKLNNELVYRGDKVNNYVKLSDKIYRIVKIVDNHAIIILTDQADSVKWDDRYNIDKRSNVGINDYTVSRMRDYLETLYNGNSLLTNEAKLLVTSHDVKIGNRSEADTDKTGNLENAIVLENQYISLLPVYDFLNASIDENCTATTSRSCVNYNYLAKYKNAWWTITGNNSNTYSVFRVANGTITTSNANKTARLRPVLSLASDAIYVSGNGSKNSPYIIK